MTREIPAIQRRFDSGELVRLDDGRVQVIIGGAPKIYRNGRSASVALWRFKNPEKYKEADVRYRANNRDKLLKSKHDYYFKNREKFFAINKKWNQDNKEKMREYRKTHAKRYLQHKRNWYANHREYARQASSNFRKRRPDRIAVSNAKRRALSKGCKVLSEAVDKLYAIARSGEHIACFYCGDKVSGRSLHLDHIIPLSRGGDHTPENLCFSCAPCNLSKANKTPEEWRASLL